MSLFYFLISSVLYIFSFPPFNYYYCAWICLVPLIIAVDKENSIRVVVEKSFFSGWIIFLGGLYWLTKVTIAGYLILTFYMAFYIAIFCIIRFYNKNFILVPVAWTVLEFIKGNLGGGMPWLILGTSQYEFLSLIQISNITGVYGVSFIVALVNSVIADLFSVINIKRKIAAFITAVLILCLTIIYGKNIINQTVSGEKIKIGIVQPNIPQDIKWDPNCTDWMLSQLLDLTKNIYTVDLIIWPETAVPTLLQYPELFKKIASVIKDLKTNIIIGTQTIGVSDNKEVKYYNSAVLVSKNGFLTGKYNKIHLVPFGEYIPFGEKIPILKKLTPIEDGFTNGNEYTLFNLTDSFPCFSVLICFEDIFPGLARIFVKKGARFLINITNDAWYDKTAACYQHAYISVFRAVENRVPFIRSTNTGLSCFIDYNGKMFEVEPFKQANENREMLVPDIKTFYTKYGDVFSWICVIILISVLFFMRR